MYSCRKFRLRNVLWSASACLYDDPASPVTLYNSLAWIPIEKSGGQLVGSDAQNNRLPPYLSFHFHTAVCAGGRPLFLLLVSSVAIPLPSARRPSLTATSEQRPAVLLSSPACWHVQRTCIMFLFTFFSLHIWRSTLMPALSIPGASAHTHSVSGLSELRNRPPSSSQLVRLALCLLQLGREREHLLQSGSHGSDLLETDTGLIQIARNEA